MDYLQLLKEELSKPEKASRKEMVLDLFAGCGGLALGFEAAGFSTVGFEKLSNACETYNKNLSGECKQILLEPNQDLVEAADVIIGGPPCQPFSVNGAQNGKQDSRDGFPAFLSAVERYHPQLVLFENVRGMLYQNNSYFAHIRKTLAQFGYLVEWKLLNAVDYGVPQKRERLFVVAHRGEWSFPEPSTPIVSFTAGDALGDLAFQTPPGSKFLTKSMDKYVANYFDCIHYFRCLNLKGGKRLHDFQW
jgi:DNA (cytosine-5)-methyltransferase 1